ncbi:MAG: hypothetical protein ACKOCB_06665 [Planctomycetia bacterium]
MRIVLLFALLLGTSALAGCRYASPTAPGAVSATPAPAASPAPAAAACGAGGKACG